MEELKETLLRYGILAIGVCLGGSMKPSDIWVGIIGLAGAGLVLLSVLVAFRKHSQR